jgi:UPF0755 protein
MKSQHNSKKKLKIGIAFIILFFIIAGSCAGIYIYREISSFIRTPMKEDATEITFVIRSGQTLTTIAENLEKEGLISDSFYFLLYGQLKNSEKKLQAGEYALSASISPEDIFDILIKGDVKKYKITIQEGLTIKDIAPIIESSTICDSTRFSELCRDPAFIGKLGINDALSLEGYLFPDTYFFSGHNTCEDIITIMVDEFKSVFTLEWKKQAEELNFSIHQAVILASMIEKETADNAEYPLISSVFHNRIKKKMRFQSDPTAVYGLEDFSGKIRRKHIRANSPYNTYRIDGFPPGPIANPGAASLKAALYPAITDYLYFVSKDGRKHYFSKNYAEHINAVNKYLRGK